jgi:hypothetical protein
MKKHDYPKSRKPAISLNCPYCNEIKPARGFITHIRLAHPDKLVDSGGLKITKVISQITKVIPQITEVIPQLPSNITPVIQELPSNITQVIPDPERKCPSCSRPITASNRIYKVKGKKIDKHTREPDKTYCATCI